ncbi:hypothetical protein [Alloactinosynnema sp. L-07]|nr:hypothetical protein [Alloactinosynnema sp. L-07]
MPAVSAAPPRFPTDAPRPVRRGYPGHGVGDRVRLVRGGAVVLI